MITKLSETPEAKISVREDAVEVPDIALQRADFDRDDPAFSRFKVEPQQFQWSEYEVRNCRLTGRGVNNSAPQGFPISGFLYRDSIQYPARDVILIKRSVT